MVVGVGDLVEDASDAEGYPDARKGKARGAGHDSISRKRVR